MGSALVVDAHGARTWGLLADVDASFRRAARGAGLIAEVDGADQDVHQAPDREHDDEADEAPEDELVPFRPRGVTRAADDIGPGHAIEEYNDADSEDERNQDAIHDIRDAGGIAADELGVDARHKSVSGPAGRGPPGPGSARSKVPTKILMMPQTESITTKPMRPQRMSLWPLARSVSLAPEMMYAFATPKRKAMNAMAKRTGIRMPLMASMTPP